MTLKFLPVLLTIALSFIFLMSYFSLYNSHPDEYSHFYAANYYTNNWLPPKVGDSAALESYSKYGFSYLDHPDIVYFLAGKFSSLLTPLEMEKYFSFRLFNVSLFLILALICIRSKKPVIFIALILSPQIWYIFSYFNGDAFPFFLSILTTYQILNKQSLFNEYLNSPSVTRYLQKGGFLLGSILGLLLISKLNYLPFILFISLYLIGNIFKKPGFKLLLFKKMLLVFLISLTIFSLRYTYDVYINGFNKIEKMYEFANTIAEPSYRTNADPTNSFFFLQLKSKGYPYESLFTQFNWHQTSFNSSVGLYGYMNILSSSWYYNTIRNVYFLFILYITYCVFKKGRGPDKYVFASVIFCSFLTIFISSYHSWINDFQAQGRYLFPVFIMIGFLIARSEEIINKNFLNVMMIIIFLLSCYSFLLFGLNFIPKF